MARIICKSSESLDDDQKSSDTEDDGNQKQMLNKLFAADTIDEEELLMDIKINDRDAEKEAKEETVTTSGEVEIDHNKNDANCLENLNSTEDDVVILRNKNNKTRLKKQNQLSSSIRLEKNRLKSTTAVGKYETPTLTSASTFTVPDKVILRIKGGKFSWGSGENVSNALEIDHLEIPKGIVKLSGIFSSSQPCTIENLKLAFHLDKLIGIFLVRSLGVLTVVVGKSGSGKSSFVGALLKEVQIKAGKIEWNK